MLSQFGYLITYGWFFVTAAMFLIFPARQAVVISVFGGVLFLPVVSFDWPGLANVDKYTVVSLALVAAYAISGARRQNPLRVVPADSFSIAWCIAVPVLTALANGLGLYNGISTALSHTLSWGVFYYAGRRYFGDQSSLDWLMEAMILAGLVYAPLALFEVRMSPRLARDVYGFFPHSFIQHIRYGGFRPIVFMDHGLMVAVFFSVATTLSGWLWLVLRRKRLRGVPLWIATPLLAVTTVLCRSANGWAFLGIGALVVAVSRSRLRVWVIAAIGLVVPTYILVRLFDIVPADVVTGIAARLFDDERATSLSIRLSQEFLFGGRALQRPLFGWGGFNRGWPVDPYTGRPLISMVDSLWTIVLSTNGLLGVVTVFGMLGVGPWMVLRSVRNGTLRHGRPSESPDGSAVGLSAIVIFFMIDSLLNAMVNPMYIMVAGALVSHATYSRFIPNTNKVGISRHSEPSRQVWCPCAPNG